MEYNILDKVWITENELFFPAIVVYYNEFENYYHVMKLDNYIWRRVIATEKQLTKRDDDFSDYLLKVRQALLPQYKFELPK